jgi:ribonuclease D
VLHCQADGKTYKKQPLVSLEQIILLYLGVKIDKFFQLADWRIRPLPKAMLSYARTDTHYLIYAYHVMIHMLNGEEVWTPNPVTRATTANLLVRTAMFCNTLLIKRLTTINCKRVKLIIKTA